VNDVFLEDVRVPAENLIGEENKGWTYAKFLLGQRAHQHGQHWPFHALSEPPQADRKV